MHVARSGLGATPSAPRRRRRALALGALVLATLGVAVLRAPATLIDRGLAHASAGHFRLALPVGTLWHGTARLAASEGSGALAPLTRLAWDFEPGALRAATLRWRLHVDGASPARLDFGPRGIAIENLLIELPPAAAFAAVPHAAARAGWRGILGVRVDHLACDLAQRCAGRLDVDWRAAGVDILPGVALGDHRLEVALTPAGATLQVSTLRRQALALDGRIELPTGARPRLTVELGGDAQLLGRVGGMLAELRPTRVGERLRIQY